MPLSAVGVLAYIAGLLLGFAGHVVLPVVGAVATVCWGIERRRPRPAAAALLLAAGALVAHATSASDAACLRTLAARRTIRVELVTAAVPGGFARATAQRCHAAVSLMVATGRAKAGFVVTASGPVTASREGLLMQHAVLRDPRPGSLLRRWREAAGRRVDSLFGSDAPLARALLVADRTGLPSELRDRYAAAGLSHMLSISGLHVALIAVAVDLVFQLLRLPRQRANAATLAVIGAYVAMLGFPPPALRAAVMLAVWTCSRWWQRPTSPWAVLALGAAIPLADPHAVTRVGYQLSMAGVAALVGASRLARRWPWMAGLRGWRRAVVGTALASTMAAAVTAPLVAWNFGRLSLIGPLANVFAAPIMALAQPMLFLALALSPVARVARWLADAAHPLLGAFRLVAAAAAAVPGASVAVTPSALTATLGVVFSAALVAACVSRFPGRALLACAASLALIVWAPVAPVGSGWTELHMLDVGQGDAIALRSARGRWVLVDAGPQWRSGDAGRSTVVPYIAHRGGDLVAFVLSAPAADHVGGAASVIRALRPRFYYDIAAGRRDAPYRASLLAARAAGATWRRIRPGDSLVVDEATLTFLGPDSAWSARRRGASASGAILCWRVGRVRMLLVGGPARAAEDWLVAHEPGLLRADVLKVASHGGAPGPSAEFLAAVAPRVALISVGAGNRAKDPSSAVMRRLAQAGAEVLRTDRQSDVVLRTDGRSLEAEAGGDSWRVPVRRSPVRPPHEPPPSPW